MGDRDQPALREHDVVVEFPRQALVEPEREIVERDALGIEIIGADRCGVAAGIAATQPALLDHGDVADAVVLREVVGGGQPVAAAADDHRVILRLRLRRAPGRRPARLAAQSLYEQRKGGISAGHPAPSPSGVRRCCSYAANARPATVAGAGRMSGSDVTARQAATPPQIASAVFTTRSSLRFSSSTVTVLPSSVEAKPH